MNEIVVFPIIGLPIALIAIFGVLADLEALAYEVSERTVEFADDAVNALDCAYEARPLTKCSPGLINADFSEEIARTNEQLRSLNN